MMDCPSPSSLSRAVLAPSGGRRRWRRRTGERKKEERPPKPLPRFKRSCNIIYGLFKRVLLLSFSEHSLLSFRSRELENCPLAASKSSTGNFVSLFASEGSRNY